MKHQLPHISGAKQIRQEPVSALQVPPSNAKKQAVSGKNNVWWPKIYGKAWQ